MARKHSLDDAFSRANTLRDRFGSLSRPSLECLDLTCRNLADADCESVRHVCTASLRALRLGGNKLTGDGVRKLTPSLRLAPNLRELWLGNNALGDEGVRTLAGELHHLPSLGELWLCGVGMGDAGARARRGARRRRARRRSPIGRGRARPRGAGVARSSRWLARCNGGANATRRIGVLERPRAVLHPGRASRRAASRSQPRRCYSAPLGVDDGDHDRAACAATLAGAARRRRQTATTTPSRSSSSTASRSSSTSSRRPSRSSRRRARAPCRAMANRHLITASYDLVRVDMGRSAEAIVLHSHHAAPSRPPPPPRPLGHSDARRARTAPRAPTSARRATPSSSRPSRIDEAVVEPRASG